MVCWEIQHSKPFENISICVICLNSAFMILDDPTAEPTDFQNAVENIFLGLYSVEMFVKICGLGFIMGSGAYLKDSWNILDFIIVVSSYPALFEDPTATDESSGSVSISGLRAFRVLRPLKTISSIKGLKVLMQALAQAVPLL